MKRDLINGPWRPGAGISSVILGQDGEPILSVFNGRNADETRARISLAVAAPDLLEVAKRIRDKLNSPHGIDGGDIDVMVHALSTAINAAEGGRA